MGIRSLVSLGIFLVPVAVTLGLVLGINVQRKAAGQQPLFVDNTISTTSYCQKSYGISPPSFGQTYTLNPNQWNWNVGDPGSLCMKVTQYNNATYHTPTTAPPFAVTWQYPPGPADAPVHAFPNIKLDDYDGTIFPKKVEDLNSIKVDIEWSYGLGRTRVKNTDVPNLEANDVNANVAIDMFLDSDATRAQSTVDSKYEIMVWLAMIGQYTEPIGYKKAPLATSVINGTTFSLYHGRNSLGQWVLTWLASQPAPNFVGDIGQLVSGMSQVAAANPSVKNIPTATDYLGYIGLGSETYNSAQYVTFAVPTLSLKVK